ncbi:MAG TPA: glycosyl hydrolase family 18 protein, partial [Candidatus Saccharimonadales bacterium]|nr:glycosyl hydrolase family 18 protein [Candidatus Saccharimonadales bacterium]
MRKFLFLLVILIGFFFLGLKIIRQNVKNDFVQPVSLPSPTPEITPKLLKIKNSEVTVNSLFVPYWALNSEPIDPGGATDLLYFGIAPGAQGINKDETGYKSIDKFVSSIPAGAKTGLVVRMIDSATTFPILEDSAKQNSVIQDSIETAKQNGFSGIVLDLEISAVPFDSLIKQVNAFTEEFHTQAGKSNLKFSLMLYGDSFYRLRPFDVKALSKNADNFMIMAYDFSKSRSNPGPNFPLNGKEVYGYDMTQMVEDFLKFLPPDRTSVVFGLFGYDWAVDDKGNALSQGKSKTYSEIKKEFLTDCPYKDCDIKRKNDSVEIEITYTDDDGKKHVVWFEDMDS